MTASYKHNSSVELQVPPNNNESSCISHERSAANFREDARNRAHDGSLPKRLESKRPKKHRPFFAKKSKQVLES